MDYESQGLLHEMFSRQAKATPEKVAVVGVDNRQMTFKELDEASDVLALNLRLKGAREDCIVGIYMERSVDCVIAYIGILKAGASYIRIEVSYPVSMVEEILSDAKPEALVVETSMVKNLPDTTRNVIETTKDWLDVLKQENNNHTVVPAMSELSMDSLAYTVYSSGTTGKPKGIQCPHRGAVFSYIHRQKAYPYGENEREACNIFFVWELLRPLIKGVTLYVIPNTVIYDPRLLCDFLKRNEITSILVTPSLMKNVINTDSLDLATSMKTMRTIFFCGEVVTVCLLERCIAILPHVRFINLYSVSEAHDIACGDLSEWYTQEQNNLKNHNLCPVGKVLPGVSVVILNEDLKPQPPGVPGEIFVGGPTLARGYMNHPEFTATRFIRRPESVNESIGERLYKTGDWGYQFSDGNLEICGRCDSMVKIRGYSTDTQAIEAALLELPQVFDCVVIVMGAEGEEKSLVAYIVPEGPTTKKAIRAILKKRLPFYMIPTHFVFLQSFPLSVSSGKLDKKLLPPNDKAELESVTSQRIN